MNHHIGPHRIYTSDWEFIRSYTPRRTAFGVLLTIVCVPVALAVAALIVWLIVTDPDALRLALIVIGLLALGMMSKGVRR